jgi:uncharacterized damage-inducible protein DinB
MLTIDDFLSYFDSVRKRTRQVADCIPPDRIEWRHRPDTFSLGDLVRHIAVAERHIWAETVHGRASTYVTHGTELASGKEAVLAYLDRMHDESMPLFRAIPAPVLAGRVTAPGGASVTTRKWLLAMVEHEAHHRGQMYTLLAMLGVDTPPLYGMTSDQVRRIGAA